MTTVQKNYGLTVNGNEYKKSNTGKVAGVTTGFVLPVAAMAIRNSLDKDSVDLKNLCNKPKATLGAHLTPTGFDLKNLDNKLEKAMNNISKDHNKPLEKIVKSKKPTGIKLLAKRNLKALGIAGCVLATTTIVSLALGNLYDKCVNKERMTQADGEAAREQRLSQNI